MEGRLAQCRCGGAYGMSVGWFVDMPDENNPSGTPNFVYHKYGAGKS